MKLWPLGEYIIVELIEEETTGLKDPEADADTLQSGIVVETGRFSVGKPWETVDVGDTVHWYRFADSGQRIVRNGKTYAHIKFERLMSKEI